MTSSPLVITKIQHFSSTCKDQRWGELLLSATLSVRQRQSEHFTDHPPIGYLCLIFSKHPLRVFSSEPSTSQRGSQACFPSNCEQVDDGAVYLSCPLLPSKVGVVAVEVVLTQVVGGSIGQALSSTLPRLTRETRPKE